jgi:hypothetical protein
MSPKRKSAFAVDRQSTPQVYPARLATIREVAIATRDQNGEIGDICAWQSKKLGDYTVQLEWSNRMGRCV